MEAQAIFGYGDKWHGQQATGDWHGFRVINMKSIKVVFNRAYRLKYT